jgi:hypothetical protein
MTSRASPLLPFSQFLPRLPSYYWWPISDSMADHRFISFLSALLMPFGFACDDDSASLGINTVALVAPIHMAVLWNRGCRPLHLLKLLFQRVAVALGAGPVRQSWRLVVRVADLPITSA